MTSKNILRRIMLAFVLTILLVWTIFPIYWIVSISFKTGSQLFSWPPVYIPFPPTLQHYIDAVKDRPILPAMKNSIIVMAVSTPFSVLIASFAAFALARFRFRGRNIIRYGFLSVRMMPGIIFAIPLFIMLQNIGFYDNTYTLMVVYTAFNLPFNIWLLTGFFEEIPQELEDAALIDGCNPLQLFFKVVFPLTTPGLVASFIFCMLLSWNEFQFALILTYSIKSQTLPIIIAGMTSDRGTFFGQMGAAGLIAILPVLALGVYVQKYLVRGLTAGAVKG